MTSAQLWNIVLCSALLLLAAYAIASRFSRRRYMREVERLAFHDSLTGLPNRMLFLDRAAIAFAHARRQATNVAVVFLDLDRFKLVNDAYGHDIGDEVLRIVGRRLHEQVREIDTVARMGGDEFTLVMPGLHSNVDIDTVSSKLLEVFRSPLEIGRREIIVTASIGISMFPADGSDVETLMTRADAAMYRVKQRGGDAVQLYTPADASRLRADLELEARLRRAFSQQEFVLYYQPRLDISNNHVVAFEALLRWNDPQRGLVGPADFIHAAEVSGLIIPIGEWVLHTACRQARLWHEDGGHDLIVSVNLSERQFHRADLAQMIERALRSERLAPRFLELEVDESCVMQQAESSMHILSRLKALGVRVLISHFGAGYSSLRYLRRFPIDGLKLDRSFLSGTNGDRPLATAALLMAKALKLKVTGEGVETEEAVQFLRTQSCDDIQGYVVSAALPPEECSRFLGHPGKVPNRSSESLGQAPVPQMPLPSR